MRVNLKRRIPTGRAGLLAVLFSLACCLAHGEPRNFFLDETAPDFWETNLVATVAGYSYIGDRFFLGKRVPVIGSSDRDDLRRDFREEVWLYSIAPTNYAGMLFRFHNCDLSRVRDIYPTNQLFVFPATTNAFKEGDLISVNDPILFSPRSASDSYCPFRTLDKWFPIDDNAVQHWTSRWNDRIESDQKEINELREKLIATDDERKRTSILRQLEVTEISITRNRSRIDEMSKQPRYFQDRIKWLESQGVQPHAVTDEENNQEQ